MHADILIIAAFFASEQPRNVRQRVSLVWAGGSLRIGHGFEGIGARTPDQISGNRQSFNRCNTRQGIMLTDAPALFGKLSCGRHEHVLPP